MVCEKELKSLKVVVTAPKFAIYTLLVVIVWWGCKGFGGVRLRVFNQ